MTLTFAQATNMYRNDEIESLTKTSLGMRFLLLRSLSRGDHMRALAERAGLNIDNIGSRDLFAYLYQSNVTIDQIKASIRTSFQEERSLRREAESMLIGELYKMNEFYWGGLHQNSLEKTIVDNYVKKIKSYDSLNENIEGALFASMKGYVRCSWYNHWTSIIIEDVFKEHEKVLPAVGLVKKIDFFVGDIPFDLKVTYLPEGYVKDERRSRDLRPELTLLKQAARRVGIAIDATLSDSDLLEHLWRIVADHPDSDCIRAINEMKAIRNELVNGISDNPERLIRWLYENQGERRFDASNRLFLVLVNQDNYFQSWQLKRNRPLIVDKVRKYLGDAGDNAGRSVSFEWEGLQYQTTADIILVRTGT
ncbi:MAG: hypothetical protein EBQ96_01270 [Proteobacteria bacterium]|nr:hypothetical protein [Pseudomonadota bacterium]